MGSLQSMILVNVLTYH